jgi:branched-chain amino acid transport system ATP-binding protein
MAALLSVEDIHTAYGLSRVLFGVSLEIVAGECVVPARPQRRRQDDDDALGHGSHPADQRAGRVEGQDITGWPPHKVARAGIGFVPEDRRIFAELTVWENLEVGGRAAAGPAIGRSRRSTSCFRCCAICGTGRAGSSPAASSRC